MFVKKYFRVVDSFEVPFVKMLKEEEWEQICAQAGYIPGSRREIAPFFFAL
jgi:hypothetical protein